MNKWKQAALLILTAAVLVLGGSLPFLTAAVQDARNQDAVRYGDMDTLTLTLRGGEAEPLDMFTKLLMLQTGEAVELAEDEINATAYEELTAMADMALADYYNAGLLLFEPGGMELRGYTPFFLYLPGVPDANAQMWVLEMMDPEGNMMNIVVDQETGKLIAMEYYTYLLTEKLGYDMESYGALLTEVYFSTLGLEPFAEQDSGYDAGISRIYYLEQENYENVVVHLTVQPDGIILTPGPAA